MLNKGCGWSGPLSRLTRPPLRSLQGRVPAGVWRPRPAPGPLHRDSLSRAARVVTPDSALQPVGCQASAWPVPTLGCAALRSGGLSFLLLEGQSLPLRGPSDLGVPFRGVPGGSGIFRRLCARGQASGGAGDHSASPLSLSECPRPAPLVTAVSLSAGRCLSSAGDDTTLSCSFASPGLCWAWGPDPRVRRGVRVSCPGRGLWVPTP